MACWLQREMADETVQLYLAGLSSNLPDCVRAGAACY